MSLVNKQMNNLETSNLEFLKSKAEQKGATEVEVLRAALAESQERYNKQSDNIAKLLAEYDKRIQKLEQSVEQSNKQKTVQITQALEKAVNEVLGDIRNKVADYNKEIEKATNKLKGTEEEKTKNERWEEVKIFCFLVVGLAIGSYISNLVWGWWYDIPVKIEAINNALWQLTN